MTTVNIVSDSTRFHRLAQKAHHFGTPNGVFFFYFFFFLFPVPFTFPFQSPLDDLLIMEPAMQIVPFHRDTKISQVGLKGKERRPSMYAAYMCLVQLFHCLKALGYWTRRHEALSFLC